MESGLAGRQQRFVFLVRGYELVPLRAKLENLPLQQLAERFFTLSVHYQTKPGTYAADFISYSYCSTNR